MENKKAMENFFNVQFTEKDTHHVELAVLACIDPRFRLVDQRAIEEGLGFKNFDLFRWPGVTKPLLTSEEFFNFFCQAIKDVSIKLHQIKKLMLLCHWDCGGYGGSGSFSCEEEEEQRYQNDLRAAQKKLQAKFPELIIMIGYSKLIDGGLHYFLI